MMKIENTIIEKSHNTLDKMLNVSRSGNDNKSWSFSVREKPILFPSFKEGFDRIATIHKRSISTQLEEGLLIYGQAGTGKTTLLKEYAARFPIEDTPTRLVIPVLYVSMPSHPSTKILAERILNALGAPIRASDSEEAREQICTLLRENLTQLICFDEIHHIVSNLDRREYARTTEWLKLLFDASKVALVFAGMPKSALLNSNKQIKRRFKNKYHLRPFEINTKSNISEFRGALKAMQKLLPLPCIDLGDAKIATRYFYATNGLIDFMAQLLEAAVTHCLKHSKSKITLEELSIAFSTEIAAELPEALNPFSAELGSLRRLDNWNEPFHDWDEGLSYCSTIERNEKKEPKK